MKINSKIKLGYQLPNFTQEIIKNEPMFFNCTWNFAYANGGEPTRRFLYTLPDELHNDKTIIDSRVHMLMKGWFPCIPGYHHDDVPREGKNGQPEYYNPSYRSKHALVVYNSIICPTQFAIGEANFTDPTKHDIIYKSWHNEVIEKINNEELITVNAPNNRTVFLDDRTWHQGTKAVDNGWRLFIRASWNTNRIPTNEIRRQVQVYLEHPMEGW